MPSSRRHFLQMLGGLVGVGAAAKFIPESAPESVRVDMHAGSLWTVAGCVCLYAVSSPYGDARDLMFNTEADSLFPRHGWRT